MSNKPLKPGWKMVKLCDVVKLISNRVDNPANSGYERFVGLEHFNAGEFKICRWGNTKNLVSSMKLFRKGDTLFARRNAYLRRASMVDFEGVCSGDAIVLREKDSVMINGYLPLILNTDGFWDYAISHAAGSMSKRVNVKALLSYQFLLPPLEEQKRISEILWAADDSVHSYKKAINVLREMRNAYIEEIAKISAGNKWPNIPITNCFDIVSGQVDPKQEPYSSMPLIAPNHIESKTGRLLKIESAYEQNAISGKYLFKPGDVVYTKIRPNLQKGFIATFEGQCSADMYALRPKPNKILTRFLFMILLSDFFARFANTRSIRTGFPKLNRKELSEFLFPVPPIKFQRDICSKLDSIEHKELLLITHYNNLFHIKERLLNSFMEEIYV